MSILKDVMDLIKDFDAQDLERMINTKKPTSISKAASEGTLQFPVLITRSLDISTLNTICSALERQFASFAQIAMTMDQTANIKEGGKGYLRKFHQNAGIKYDMNDLSNDILAITKESGVTAVIESVTANGATLKVKVSNQEQLASVLESLELNPLNKKFNPKNLMVLEKASKGSKSKGGANITEIDQQYNVSGDMAERDIVQNNTPGTYNMTYTNHNIDEKINKNINQSSVKDRKVFNGHNILRDNDVKKSNELVPTTMHIRVIIVNDAEEAVDTVDFIVGVKAVMHPIKSEEMIENVYNGCRQNGPFFNFIRWTTGEISFMKDLILRVNETKLDVYNRSAGASHWWMALKRRKNMARLRNKVFLPGGLLPNTSIVMTMEEVDYIKTRYGYNLMDERVVDKVMNEYFLLSFVIVDMAGEIAHFMFDGQTSYQSTTFDGLRRETSNQNNINEVIKMANRLRM